MRVLPFIFSIALFGSAFLSFSIQPLIGKMLLPMAGGAPGSWIVTMAFFQVALLAGYGLSYFLMRFNPWLHGGFLIILYAMGCLFVPPVLKSVIVDGGDMALGLDILASLALSITVPFLALTATTSALQRLFAATAHPTAKDPYYLFIASNLGSFVGLFCYPFLFEPFFGLITQSRLWQFVYFAVLALVAASAALAWYNRSEQNKGPQDEEAAGPVHRPQIWSWFILAFIPCSLSMGVTTWMITDIGGLPLFWVIPLGLYLVTFILAFARKRILPTKRLDVWHLTAAGFLTLALGLGVGHYTGGSILDFTMIACGFLAAFFMIAWSCHQKLADRRPPVRDLGLFYFMIALGGAAAGLVHALVLPFALNSVVEFPLVVLLSLLLHPHFRERGRILATRRHRTVFYAIFGIAALCGLLNLVLQGGKEEEALRMLLVPVFIIGALILAMQPRLLLALGLIMLVASQYNRFPGRVLHMDRNFFGAQAVFETPEKLRYFMHGSTIHGMAVSGKMAFENRAHSYYAQGNPIADILNAANAAQIGVIGLGVGQMACYDPTLAVDFYEIDPTVQEVALTYFPYLAACRPRDIFIGDGRLMIDRIKRRYDVLVLDAFTSDGIPTHLLTRDAFAVYRAHLNANGILLYHISNRYFDLAPVLAAVAKAERFDAFEIKHKPGKDMPLAMASQWLAISMRGEEGAALEKQGWTKAASRGQAWTDDRSSMLSALKMRPFKD